ncbi:MAG TPA: hypothetical protein VIS27_09660 [Yeosuana sp.]
MKNHFYVTDYNSNGTTDLIITDSDHQIIGTIEEALIGSMENSALDSLGGLTCTFYGESIGYIDYSDEEEMIEGILNGEDSDFQAVSHVSNSFVKQFIAVSSIDPDGELVIDRINDIVGYKLLDK